MRERRDLSRVLPLLATALLVGSALALLPFRAAWPAFRGFAFYFDVLCVAAAGLAWWIRRRWGHLLVGAAAVLLAGLCFTVSVGLAYKLWSLKRFHAVVEVACRDVVAPDHGATPFPAAQIIEHQRRTDEISRQAVYTAGISGRMAEALGVHCDGARTYSYIFEGFEETWFMDARSGLH